MTPAPATKWAIYDAAENLVASEHLHETRESAQALVDQVNALSTTVVIGWRVVEVRVVPQ